MTHAEYMKGRAAREDRIARAHAKPDTTELMLIAHVVLGFTLGVAVTSIMAMLILG